MKKFIIDRFEGMYAICEEEDKTMLSIPKYRLPLDCKEGDCIILNTKGMYQKDNEVTMEREKRIRDKMDRLFK